LNAVCLSANRWRYLPEDTLQTPTASARSIYSTGMQGWIASRGDEPNPPSAYSNTCGPIGASTDNGAAAVKSRVQRGQRCHALHEAIQPGGERRMRRVVDF